MKLNCVRLAIIIILLKPSLLLSQNYFFDTSTIKQVTLDNGFKVIIKVDKRSPIFNTQLWYKVGASYEYSPITGISHMLEHMMFKSTKNYKAGEFSNIIANNGGNDNAFTGQDFTAYYQIMHKSKLELAIKLEAERMRNLVISSDELAKERKVVIEERHLRVDDNVYAKVFEKLKLVFFVESGPYHSPIIGFQQDIENYNLTDLKDWYEKYYSPNNASLVVVGDVDAAEVISLANTYFGIYDKNPNITTRQGVKSLFNKNNKEILKLRTKLSFFTIAFPVPSFITATDKKTAYSLEMLAYVLDSYLTKNLIRKKQIAADIDMQYGLYDKFDNLFIISFVSAKEVSNEALLNEIKQEILNIINEPDLIKNTIQQMKAQIEAEFFYEQDKIWTQAYYLGLFTTIGIDTNELFNYVTNMQALTKEDISYIARNYINFNQANIVELIPLKN